MSEAFNGQASRSYNRVSIIELLQPSSAPTYYVIICLTILLCSCHPTTLILHISKEL